MAEMITDEMRRHSAAHMMARAVMNVFPDVQVDIGPATDDGFYYDFDLPHRIAPEDFPKIEAEIARLIALDEPFVRKEVTADEAKALLAGQKYKLERLADVVADGVAISTYTVGDYVEMCRGPHVEHSKQIGVVKLVRVAGSYYRGDEHNKMLQRVYGIVARDQAELDEIIAREEEAKKRDHRVLGRQLELFDEPVLLLWVDLVRLGEAVPKRSYIFIFRALRSFHWIDAAPAAGSVIVSPYDLLQIIGIRQPVDELFHRVGLSAFCRIISRVFFPARPSTSSLNFFWKARTAFSVLLPKTPSAVPFRKPRSISACCSSLTSSPREPLCSVVFS